MLIFLTGFTCDKSLTALWQPSANIPSISIFSIGPGIKSSLVRATRSLWHAPFRLFKEHLNTTPKTYLESKRLVHSQILLKEGKSVLDACMESGFPDYSNYIRLFKRRFGVTPKQYKDSQ